MESAVLPDKKVYNSNIKIQNIIFFFYFLKKNYFFLTDLDEKMLLKNPEELVDFYKL